MSVKTKIKEKVGSFPHQPGVYIMKDRKSGIIYIGKAKHLKKRVNSYFTKKHDDDKTALLVADIRDVDYIVTDTEIEALLLEAELIRKHRPKYNIDLKDSMRYAYLLLTDEKWPRILTVRDKSQKGTYFGPFTDAHTRETLAELAQRLFKLRTCSVLPKKPCLQFHIKRCDAPCINNISHAEYMRNVQSAKLVLKGKTKELIVKLKKKMKIYSAKQEYEYAQEVKHQIEALERIGSRQKVATFRKYNQDVIAYRVVGEEIIIQLFVLKRGVIHDKKEFRFAHSPGIFESFLTQYYSINDLPKEVVVSKKLKNHDLIAQFLKEQDRMRGDHTVTQLLVPQKGVKKQLVKLVEKNIDERIKEFNEALVELRRLLNLQNTPYVIECFDISNLRDVGLVGAMVQYRGNAFDKSNYRRFRIRSTETQDDFASMAEVVHRRYARLVREDKQLPDLIVIDGGRGQLNVAYKELEKLGVSIPIIGLAKKEEEIYIVDEQKPLKVSKKKKSLKLLIQIRNEVHRFAISYHRLVRGKKFLGKR